MAQTITQQFTQARKKDPNLKFSAFKSSTQAKTRAGLAQGSVAEAAARSAAARGRTGATQAERRQRDITIKTEAVKGIKEKGRTGDVTALTRDIERAKSRQTIGTPQQKAKASTGPKGPGTPGGNQKTKTTIGTSAGGIQAVNKATGGAPGIVAAKGFDPRDKGATADFLSDKVQGIISSFGEGTPDEQKKLAESLQQTIEFTKTQQADLEAVQGAQAVKGITGKATDPTAVGQQVQSILDQTGGGGIFSATKELLMETANAQLAAERDLVASKNAFIQTQIQAEQNNLALTDDDAIMNARNKLAALGAGETQALRQLDLGRRRAAESFAESIRQTEQANRQEDAKLQRVAGIFGITGNLTANTEMAKLRQEGVREVNSLRSKLALSDESFAIQSSGIIDRATNNSVAIIDSMNSAITTARQTAFDNVAKLRAQGVIFDEEGTVRYNEIAQNYLNEYLGISERGLKFEQQNLENLRNAAKDIERRNQVDISVSTAAGQGVLMNSQGQRLIGKDGQPIDFDPAAKYITDPDTGEILVIRGNEITKIDPGQVEIGQTTRLPGVTRAGGRLPRANRNNNPGNLRAGGTTDDGGFTQFGSVEEGFAALERDLTAKLTGNSPATRGKLGRNAKTLLDVISVFAPREDNNDPDSYAQFVANELGISPNEPVANLTGRVKELARAFAKREGFKEGAGTQGAAQPEAQPGAQPEVTTLPSGRTIDPNKEAGTFDEVLALAEAIFQNSPDEFRSRSDLAAKLTAGDNPVPKNIATRAAAQIIKESKAADISARVESVRPEVEEFLKTLNKFERLSVGGLGISRIEGVEELMDGIQLKLGVSKSEATKIIRRAAGIIK